VEKLDFRSDLKAWLRCSEAFYEFQERNMSKGILLDIIADEVVAFLVHLFREHKATKGTFSEFMITEVFKDDAKRGRNSEESSVPAVTR
jgi:hypothetical protein